VQHVQDLPDGMSILKESFLGFSQAENLTGEGVSEQIQQLLTQWGLELNKLRRQRYDSAA